MQDVKFWPMQLNFVTPKNSLKIFLDDLLVCRRFGAQAQKAKMALARLLPWLGPSSEEDCVLDAIEKILLTQIATCNAEYTSRQRA